MIRKMMNDYLYDMNEEGANKELVEETHNKLFSSRGLRLGTIEELPEGARKLVLDNRNKKALITTMKGRSYE